MICRSVITSLCVWGLATQTLGQDPARFLATYCVRCHGPAKQEADRRFDQLAELSVEDRMVLWQDALDRINLGDMPPAESRQPAAAERVVVAEQIGALVAAARKSLSPAGKATLLRRLNRFEYDRSVRQLLSLEGMLADPTDSFPPDDAEDHFRNIGSKLVMSDFHLRSYLNAAQLYCEAATHPQQQPRPQTWRFTAPFCPTGNRHDGLNEPGRFQHIRKNYHDAGGFLWIRKLTEGVPHSGDYRIRVRAEAIGRDYPYPEQLVKVMKADSLRMEIVAGTHRGGDLSTNNPTDVLLAEFELPDNSPQWFEVTAWLDQGYQPRIAFPNGPISTKALRSRLVRDYPERFSGYIAGHVPKFNTMHPEFDPAERDRLAAEFLEEQRSLKVAGKPYAQFGLSHPINTRQAWSQFFSEYEGPRIRVYQIHIEGPFYDTWPPESHRRLFGDSEVTEDDVRPLIERFVERAYRRPVADEQVDSLVDLQRSERERGASLQDSLLSVYQAVLSSPGFLYFHQRPGQLDQYDLATRLSYFLWSAPPDAELLETARAGELADDAVLGAQVDRMVSDPRAQVFVEQFTNAWLRLDKLGTMLPSQRAHPEYFNENLEQAMRRETHLFVDDLLQNDGPLSDFLVGDRTFLNGPLARLYGVEGVHGHEFRRVRLGTELRGGLLGMASVLTATANGIETSPVVRGVWVLECILGTPPPAPPPDVEPIEPDIRGAKSIREQLAMHRNVSTCNACHRKIDPLGFALESFDEIGRHRTHYVPAHRRGRGARLPVDSSGELPTGERFANVAELRPLLLGLGDQFVKNLTAKLLTYGTGRLPTVHDRLEVDEIAGAVSLQVGFRDLIRRVVQSDAFQR